MDAHPPFWANRVADAIKDALLDGFDEDADPTPLAYLPRCDAEAFVERMRGDVEATLRRLADIVNAAPGDAPLSASEDETCELFTGLWWKALQTAVQLRYDGMLVECHREQPPPEGVWARRYRTMIADTDADAPSSPDEVPTDDAP